MLVAFDVPMTAFETKVRLGLQWIAGHTGIPIVIVAAAVVVISWRVLKKTTRLFVEVAVLAALLAIATKLGWISW